MPNETKQTATQVDQGWRSTDTRTERQSTQVDTGWRRESSQAERKATQVDTGWRVAGDLSGKKATEVDQGWRTAASTGRQATQIDEGWRKNAADMLDPENVMNKATANYFLTLDDFKKTVAQLPQLISSTNNIYPVKKTLSTAGGESIILMCSDPDGNDVVAKVYYEPVNSAGSSISARSRVLEYMGTEEGKKYTLAVTEIGLVEFGNSKYYFEIMPYCDGGDVSDDGAFPFDDLVALIKHLNEAMHSIHEAGIIHRDIKPQNIYKMPHGIVLGDFGTAKISDNGTMATTHVVKSFGYTAPELLLGISNNPTFFYTTKIDYYSLGVTIGSLFEGRFVYEGMDDGMITLCVQKGKLPLRRTDPHRAHIENLVSGLCRFDARHRFGYEEVNKWLADHNYTGGGIEEDWPKAFRMLGEEYRDEQSLFNGITKDEAHWNEGKTMLYSKIIEQFFMSFRTDLARSAQIADELYRGEDRDKGLSVFLKNLFAPGPIVWKGYTFKSLSELGTKMVATKTPAAYSELLKNHCISHWLANTEGIEVDEATKKLVDEIEELSAKEPEIACYWFGNAFASKRSLQICGNTVSTVAELIEAMFDSPCDFYQIDGFTKLTSRTEGADLYGFLFSLGYKDLVNKEWEHLKQCDLFNKTTILLSMMDNIAVKAGVSPTPVRNFFVTCGPVGIAIYTKALVSKSENSIYMALDSSGRQVLSKIMNFKTPNGGTVDELFRAYTPLIQEVDNLRRMLIENPHCILTGVYESRGVICTNLSGVFAFKIFDRLAPLGFNAWIVSAKGGKR